MMTYLVNSTLCSGLLLAAYHLLLKNKAMYNFNRFYLLAGIMLSLLAPLIVVRHNIAPFASIVPIQTKIVTESRFVSATPITPELPSAEPIDYRLYSCVLIYAVITFLLIFRLIRNLYSIHLTLVRHKKISFEDARLVLIEQNLTPHTFLNYIFLNEGDYYQKRIEAEVLRHELAHARQWHSIDIILVELVQAVFWFNPFLFLYRKNIRVNHEFIADAAALHKDNVAAYQNLLISKAAQLQSLSITSQFNYSITKKRLIMMTKTTSGTTAWLTRLAIVPVIAAAFMLFCTKTKAQQKSLSNKKNSVIQSSAKTAKTDKKVLVTTGNWVRLSSSDYPSTKDGISGALMDEYIANEKKYTRYQDVSKIMTKPEEQRMEYLYQQMSRAQQKNRTIFFEYPPPPLKGGTVSRSELESWSNPLVYGIWVDGKRIKNSELKNRRPNEFNKIFFSRLTDIAVKHDKFHYQVDLMTLQYYKKYREDAIVNKHNSMIVFHMKS